MAIKTLLRLGRIRKMMLEWKLRDNAKCPQCEEIEDTHHGVEWLTETTSPCIQSAVMTHMKAYQCNVIVGGFRSSNEETKATSQAQDELGRRSFGEELFEILWRLRE